MENKSIVATMQEISKLVCRPHGHSIACVTVPAIMGEPARPAGGIMCVKCGATLAEIRGEK